MAALIPIANLYYLLSYAWNHRLSEADLAQVDAETCPDLNNLFARILASETRRLLRSGLDRSYLAQTEETPRIRGRIDFSASEKIQSRTRGKLVCSYDELSPDVLHNRIVKATLRLLVGDPLVHAGSRKALRQSLEGFAEVGDLRVTAHHFHRVQLHRNNRAYRFLLHLCELIHGSLLPEKAPGSGLRFRDFVRDETLMARVFEDFVRNFAARHLDGAHVSAAQIQWQASELSEGGSAMLPRMLTDVTVAWPHRKLILDCKYYQDALVSRYDALRFRSGHLFQLNAYLTNQAAAEGWEEVEGILLYPSNGYRLDHRFLLHSRHRVRVVTLDLMKAWTEIDGDLRGVFEEEGFAYRGCDEG
jgi:5-methylcytosine-specific restriction enzyme subunit McrC